MIYQLGNILRSVFITNFSLQNIHVFVSVVKKRLTALGVLLTKQILLFEYCI